MKAIRLTAPWCQPCANLKKLLDQHDISLETIDTDQDATLAKLHNVRGLPTILILEDDGTESTRYTGSTLTSDQIARLKELSI